MSCGRRHLSLCSHYVRRHLSLDTSPAVYLFPFELLPPRYAPQVLQMSKAVESTTSTTESAYTALHTLGSALRSRSSVNNNAGNVRTCQSRIIHTIMKGRLQTDNTAVRMELVSRVSRGALLFWCPDTVMRSCALLQAFSVSLVASLTTGAPYLAPSIYAHLATWSLIIAGIIVSHYGRDARNH